MRGTPRSTASRRDGTCQTNIVRWRSPLQGGALAMACTLVALTGCAKEVGPEEKACAQLVRFHLGLHRPVEVEASERTANKPRVRIRYRSAGKQGASVSGTALCRFSNEKGRLDVVGAWVDETHLEGPAIIAFNRLQQVRRREAGG